MQVM